MKERVNKFILKFGGYIAALALMVTASNINATCVWVGHQPEMPVGADKLKKSC